MMEKSVLGAGAGAAAPEQADDPVLDIEMIDELVDVMGGADFAVMAARFLDDGTRRLALIRAAFANRDWPGLDGHAHSLKGTAANLGFNALAAGASRLREQLVKCRGTEPALLAGEIDLVACNLDHARRGFAALVAADPDRFATGDGAAS